METACPQAVGGGNGARSLRHEGVPAPMPPTGRPTAVKSFASLRSVDYPSSAVSSTSSGPIRAVAKFFFEGDRKFFVKGVTYGPFRPDSEGHYLGSPEQAQRDLAQMREIGLNLVRIYHVPPRW